MTVHRQRKKEPPACVQGMKYLETVMPGFKLDWPMDAWAINAAKLLIEPLPAVKYTRLEKAKDSAARRKVKFTVVVATSGCPWVKYHRFYTDKKRLIAGRLWSMRKNLCDYVEVDETV